MLASEDSFPTFNNDLKGSLIALLTEFAYVMFWAGQEYTHVQFVLAV